MFHRYMCCCVIPSPPSIHPSILPAPQLWIWYTYCHHAASTNRRHTMNGIILYQNLDSEGRTENRHRPPERMEGGSGAAMIPTTLRSPQWLTPGVYIPTLSAHIHSHSPLHLHRQAAKALQRICTIDYANNIASHPPSDEINLRISLDYWQTGQRTSLPGVGTWETQTR